MKFVIIGSDHAGFKLKTEIKFYLLSKKYNVFDIGCYSEDAVNYPDFAHKLAYQITETDDCGILVCGTGNGVNITANKHSKIRSALCWNTEIAELARKHNNANVLCLPGRFLEKDDALEVVEKFLNTDFEGGRHLERINLIENLTYITKLTDLS